MIGRSYGDRMQCWPSGINCQNFVLDKGTISQDSPLVGLFFIGRSAFAHLCEQGKQKKQGAPLAFMIDQADAHMSARSLCAEIIVLFPFSDRKNQVKRT